MPQSLPKRTSIAKLLSNADNWLPDWQDTTQYPDPKTTPSRVWAWEFLRRNQQYQKLWEKLTDQYDRKQIKRREVIETFAHEFGIIAPYPPHPFGTCPDPFSLSFLSEGMSKLIFEKGKITIYVNDTFDEELQLFQAQHTLSFYKEKYSAIKKAKEKNKRFEKGCKKPITLL